MESFGGTKALSFYSLHHLGMHINNVPSLMKVGSSDAVGLSLNLGQKDYCLSLNRP